MEDLEHLPWDGELEKYSDNPVLSPDPSLYWEHGAAYNATAIEKDGKVYLFYRGEDRTPEEDPEQREYVSRIGLAVSDDGIHFQRTSDEPIIDADTGPYAAMKCRGVEDPRVVEVEGQYLMTYTGYDGDRVRMFLATSDDLETWTEHGPILDGMKAGAIVPQKVDGQYVMYCGDTNLWVARSDDGIHWDRDPNPVMKPRPAHFDNVLVESGPAPLVTDDGILLVYNSCDDKGRYNAGAALFSLEDPRHLIQRTEEPILSPTEDYERDHKHAHLTDVVFIEGMVERDGQYILYYGAGDEHVAVATARSRKE